MNNKDTIYKQDAIDIVTFECGKWKGLSKEITKQINALPPVQLEIIHCKDCLYKKICSWKNQGAKFCSFGERGDSE